MSLKLDDYQTELEDVLKRSNEHYMTAYQICRVLEEHNNAVWSVLVNEYQMDAGNPEMGKGAGKYYSPATYVSQALNYIMEKGETRIYKETFDPVHTELGEVQAGADDAIAIWAWRD